MQVLEKNEEGITIVKPLIERLDAVTADDFKETMANIINKNKRYIILNLSDIQFIDSRGLGAIISVYKMVVQNGLLALTEATANVSELFKLTRMDRVFPIYLSEQEAILEEIVRKRAV